MGEWKAVRLQELCSKITSGGTPSRRIDEYFDPLGIPWIKTKELQDRVIFSSEESISELGMENSSAKLLPKDTVLVAMYGATAGQLGVLGRPMACNQACCALVVNPKVADWRFVYYRLRFSREEVKSLANGAAQQNLSAKTLANVSVMVPGLQEQRAIAGVLGALDDKIAVNERIAESCMSLAQAHIARELPNSRRFRLVDVANIVMGSSPPGDTYNEDGEGLPFYQGTRDFGYRYPSVRVFCSAPVRTAPAGATLVSVRAPVGRVNVAKEDCCIGRGLASLVSKQGSPSVLFHTLSSIADAWSPYESEGTVFGSINKNQLEGIEVPVFETETLGKLEPILGSLDSSVRSATDESGSLAQLRDTLLPKLMSGEIRVKDAERLVEEAT